MPAPASLAEMDRHERVRHVVAVAVPIVVLAVQAIVWWLFPTSVLRPIAGFLCIAGMFVGGWLGGLVVGLLATFATAVPLAWLLVTSPGHPIVRSAPNVPVMLPVFLGLGVLASVFHERLRRAQHRRLAAERALRRSEARFSGILSTAFDAIVSIDADQRIVLYNDAAARLFGYTRDEILGHPITRLMPDRFRADHDARIRRLATAPTTRISRPVPIIGLRNDGQEFSAEASLSKLQLDGGDLFTIVVRDVTVQQQLERELIDALDEQMFLARIGETFASSLECAETLAQIAQMSVEVLGDFLVINLIDGGTLHRLKVACSDPSRVELARALEELPREQFQPTLVRGAIETRKTQQWSAATPDEVLRADATDPAVRALFIAVAARSILFVPLIARGEVIGVMSVVSSQPGRRYGVSDVRLAEEIARRAALALDNVHLYQTARDAIAARDEVLGVVAHDLRNPLSAIELGARLIQERAPAELERPVAAILRSADRASRLIEDLLEIRRAQVGRLEVRRDNIPPVPLLFDIVEAHRPLFAAREVALELERLCPLPTISADRDRLLQVFDNLLGNAMKFTPRGGRVTIGGRDDDDRVVFWVGDTGPGLGADEVSHLFDRFWQAGETDRRGLGIGLAIAREIVEAHGGEIWADSEAGRGTIVSFAIPKAVTTRAHAISP